MNGIMDKYPMSQDEYVIVEIAEDKRLGKKYFVPATDKESLTNMNFISDNNLSECKDGIWICKVIELHSIPAPSNGSFRSLNYKITPCNIIKKKEDDLEIKNDALSSVDMILDHQLNVFFITNKLNHEFASFYHKDIFSTFTIQMLYGRRYYSIFKSEAYQYIYGQLAKSENFIPPAYSKTPIGFEYLFDKFVNTKIPFKTMQSALNNYLSSEIFKNRYDDDEYTNEMCQLFPRFSRRLLSIMKEIDQSGTSAEDALKQMDEMIYNNIKTYNDLYGMSANVVAHTDIVLKFPLWMEYVEQVMKYYEEKKLREKEERKAKRKAAKNNASGI